MNFLEYLGHEIYVVHDGPAAIDSLDIFYPDLVLLDIGLPGMHSYEVARELRKRESKKMIIVAVTGYGQEEDKRKSEKAGFDYHFVKPVDIDFIQKIIEF